MATPTPDAEPWRLDEDRRKEFLEWFDKANFRQFKDGVYNCNDPALRDKVWDLLSDYYEAGFEYSAWKTVVYAQFTSKAGYGELIVLSGTPMIGSGPAVQPGSVNMITNDDYVSPLMSCVYISNARRKIRPAQG
ncbi:hypothetical protein M432DRAFT_542378 [Thermoascus aurantiacus ATCC 26904]